MTRQVPDDKSHALDNVSAHRHAHVTFSPSVFEQDVPQKPHYGFAFWAIFAALVLTTMLSALDGSVVSTAMPTIIREIEAGNNYVWIINIYFLTG